MSRGIPRVRAGECHVWIADAVRVPSLLELLDARERARHDAFVRDRDRALYLTAHALVRQLVAAQLGTGPREVVFTQVCRHCDRPEPHGKPGLADSSLEFSLSHSGDRVAVALSLAGPVGVDIEETARQPDLPQTVLAAVERAELERLPAGRRALGFTRYWARKEAVLKATGDGLMVEPALLTVSAPGAPAALLEWRKRAEPHRAVRLHDVDVGNGYRAAVAVLGDECRVVCHTARYDGDGTLRTAPAVTVTSDRC
ncbi:4'-phosphopantetheinyl transferase superfamily protein [Streptomyces ficellus]|uniref:4'-phosphopantetheinyl transferase superfamily protein n=1 Tax=Streptomyces ficellus TaxID=1977088 RepID=A0ABT7Z5D7_9ACTN|nr:4'-phosphopantetheinyl transferase superfamily protein [Streptomyces ficellus]MDN3294477.1 4'-phosphopantetheinyl transferase superfamily protein [Streptomyces ficellus]